MRAENEAAALLFSGDLEKNIGIVLPEICNKYIFKRGETLRILSYKKDADRIEGTLSAKRAILPSKIYELLEDVSYEVVLLIVARSGSNIVKGRVADFLTKYNGFNIN